MATNERLKEARVNNKDEFYTLTEDIELELRNYKEYFRGKRIYCPCDDARWSNFWWYFVTRYNELELKSLDASCFHEGQHGEHWHYEGKAPTEVIRQCVWDKDRSKLFAYCDYEVFEDEGGFQDRADIFAKTDVVVTNPPFSIFRNFVQTLQAHKLDFVIWGNTNAVIYREMFNGLRNNTIFPGYLFNKQCVFRISDKYTEWNKEETEARDDGNHYAKVVVATFTSFNVHKLHRPVEYYERYTAEKYPNFDNFEGINIDAAKKIPCDYTGIMGVPITWLSQFCPDQFELLGITNYKDLIGLPFTNNCYAEVNGVRKYVRILIRWKPEAMPRINEKGVIIYD